MLDDSATPVQVEYTPEFKRNLRALGKKYPHIRSDIEPLIGELQSGNIVGDQIPGAALTIFKVRIRNSDIQKGKSSGYRVVYQLKAAHKIVLVTLYSKLDQSDISARRLREIIGEFEIAR